MIEWDLFQGCNDGSIFTINVIHHINKRKEKKSHDHLNKHRKSI